MVRGRVLGALERRDLVEGWDYPRGQRPRAPRARGGRLARARVLARPEAPRARAGGRPGGAAPRGEAQPQADRPQGGHGRRRQEAVRGQLRHGARDGLLGVGDSGDGRRVARRRPRTQGPAPARAALEAVGRPLEFFVWAVGTPPRPSTDSDFAARPPAVATKCAAEKATRGY